MRWLTKNGEIPEILEPYARVDRTRHPGPCWVLANMVGGLDGSATVDGLVGQLSNETDQHLFQALRSLSDVVLVGAETVRRERYGPVRLPAPWREMRREDGRLPVPALAVVSRSLELDWEAPAFAAADPGSRTIVVTCAAADGERQKRAAEVADVVVAGDERVDLAVALDALAARGAGVVLCEGGPTLLGELVALGLLDELCLTLSPVLGGDALPVAVSPAGTPLTHLQLADTFVDDETLYLRYER
jgi:riboflavin biosynthesis pyrimidine reductase